MEKDHFRPSEEGEMILGPEVPYLSAIGALTYLVNYTRLDLAFAMNLLARYSLTLIERHWKGVKHILRISKRQSTWDYFTRKDPFYPLLAM